MRNPIGAFIIATKFKVADPVTWNSKTGHVSGKIIEVHTKMRTTRDTSTTPAPVREALKQSTGSARAIARATMEMVHDALDLDYLRKYR